MLSNPPATMTSLGRTCRASKPIITVFMPDPHILLTVVHGTDCGKPAPIEAWRAGAWPWPAGSTQPISPSLTAPGSTGARLPEKMYNLDGNEVLHVVLLLTGLVEACERGGFLNDDWTGVAWVDDARQCRGLRGVHAQRGMAGHFRKKYKGTTRNRMPAA